MECRLDRLYSWNEGERFTKVKPTVVYLVDLYLQSTPYFKLRRENTIIWTALCEEFDDKHRVTSG